MSERRYTMAVIEAAWADAWYKYLESDDAGAAMIKSHFYSAFKLGADWMQEHIAALPEPACGKCNEYCPIHPNIFVGGLNCAKCAAERFFPTTPTESPAPNDVDKDVYKGPSESEDESAKPKRQCSRCGSYGLLTERRPNGDTTCMKCGRTASTASFDIDARLALPLTAENLSEPLAESLNKCMDEKAGLMALRGKQAIRIIELEAEANRLSRHAGDLRNAHAARIAELEAENERTEAVYRMNRDWMADAKARIATLEAERDAARAVLEDRDNAHDEFVQKLQAERLRLIAERDSLAKQVEVLRGEA